MVFTQHLSNRPALGIEQLGSNVWSCGATQIAKSIKNNWIVASSWTETNMHLKLALFICWDLSHQKGHKRWKKKQSLGDTIEGVCTVEHRCLILFFIYWCDSVGHKLIHDFSHKHADKAFFENSSSDCIWKLFKNMLFVIFISWLTAACAG